MVALFSLAGLCEVCAYGQVTAFTPLHLPEIGIEPTEVAFWVGAITSASSVVGLPFLPFWGALADRFGRKPLIIRSFVAAFVALALTAIAPNVWVFAVARGIQSLGLGNTGLMLATLAENAPRERVGLAFGLVNGANPVGAFLGPLVGGPIVDQVGFGALLASDALVMALVVALLVFGYRDGFAPGKTTRSLTAMARDGVVLIVRSRRLRVLFPAYFVLFSGWMLAYIYVPLIVARLYSGTDPATVVGVVFGAGGVTALVATPGIGALADRFGHWRTLLSGAVVMCGLWLLPYFARDLFTFTLLWALINGIVSGVFSVSFNVLAASATDAERGRVMTFGYLPANMGFVLGPAIGSVVASVDVFLVFPTATALTGLGLAAIVYAQRQPVAG
ncbi:MAG TPA: MFS transporter [Candidatus Limnocylindria bacterium]|jgi:DHA1 family multidrug resistance protein-like MFS transporter|nr:MFS transporter [Candidatus Limnocylindria bacterium]